MADVPNTNPFLDDDDEERTVIAVTEENDVGLQAAKTYEHHEISLDALAGSLLKENFVLTALEFHTELLETGREIPRLRDYFSNPGNFERTKDEFGTASLHRTSSIQTFDSLDFARYSDEGGGQVDERVAVLEFELRKAQETIKSLRASLTKEAENELSSTEQVNEGIVTLGQEEAIKPLERRAINFLINEFLLQQNYKLTAVTFSEENEDQDFEDWDDVGLNIARPPSLLHLYKDFGSHAVPTTDTMDYSCQVELQREEDQRMEEQWKDLKSQLEYRISELEDQIKICSTENDNLISQITELNSQRSEIQVIYNSAPLKSSNSSSREVDYTVGSENTSTSDINNCVDDSNKIMVNGESVMEANCDSETKSVIERDQSMDMDGDQSKEEDISVGSPDFVVLDTERSKGDISPTKKQSPITENPKDGSGRHLSSTFRKALLDVCFHVSKDNRIVHEVSQIIGADRDHIITMLGRCLPHIVPNVLLAKREELIPLILCTAMLHPDSRERDKLLNILFNLIKKPDEEQRQMILTGCVAFAQHTGSARLIEELLPQCWEQINHKYLERRILVAEACGALASYLPTEILSSLILSMLQQMMADDKEAEVREAVVRSLGILFGIICDTDKYTQGCELLWASLKDSSERVVMTTLHVFLPSLAIWADELDKLQHNLIHSVVRDLEELCALAAQKASSSTHIPLNEARFMNSMSALQELMSFLYVSVIKTGPYCNNISNVLHRVVDVDISQFPKPSSLLTDLKVVVGDKDQLSALVHLFEHHISQEWFEPWDSLNWVVNNLIPRLLEVVLGAGLALPKIVNCLCRCFFLLSRTFGKVFVEKKMRPKFIEMLILTDEHTDHRGYANAKQTSVTTCIVPVYAAGVLSAFSSEEDRQQLSQFLQEILCTLSMYQAPLDSLKAAFTELSSTPSNHELLLTVLWDGVMHTSPQVRASSARLFELMVKGVGENLISTRVFPALVTLGSDPEIIVRTATIPALGAIIENVSLVDMLDRVYMQFITFMDDPVYRDEHEVNIELIHTLSRVAPNAEPRFRDDLILPRLAFVALNNNHQQDDKKRTEVALQLFEAYSSLSCCFINDQLVQEAMLPGLRCLKQDMAAMAPEREEVVSSIIREYETKVEGMRSGTSHSGTTPNLEDVKSRVMNRIKDTTSKANISNIFTRKK
ncbi:RAB11-binding protein RELCH homolog isoform X2 [Ostrea edulis]|uniref:RAB11-binding protein RELCH homolog isoform X2 n=1 Tax=Ostrea edulis TaxID=37623 RepID=UPI00209492DC|nr:RAB11-binding protein RELCH homolog isoform X2 [Ostrea edulis]